MRFIACLLISLVLASTAAAQPDTGTVLLRPARVWTGTAEPPHTDWAVVVENGRVAAVGPLAAMSLPAGVREIALPNVTLTPGLIDLHTHLLLREYSAESWDDQVLKDSEAMRVIRAVGAARATLLAGFTTIRDLGTEGAGYSDVALRQAADNGAMLGPRMFVATRAIVARGAYGPRRTAFRPDLDLPQGAEEASGVEEVIAAVRSQMAYGADLIKLYADHPYGNSNEPRVTFSQEELAAAVKVAHDAGLRVAVHATTDAGMRRAILAGADTIEHGYGGTRETFRLMARRGIGLLPTLAAADAMQGAGNARSPEAFRRALAAGVKIGAGSDAGVFPHGQNARELELMVQYGMTPLQAMIAATSTNAAMLGESGRLGVVAPDAWADLVGFSGDPTADIREARNVVFVMKQGVVVREHR